MSQLLIRGAPLTFTLSASGLNTTVYVDGCDYTVETRKFTRKEFSNAYLLNLPEADGSEPIFVKNAVGKKIQIDWNCGDSTVRDVTPDDNNVDKILKTFESVVYTIVGGPTAPSSLDPIFPVFEDHKLRYMSFESYLDIHSLNISIDFALKMQNLTFSYLTNTGLTVSSANTNNATGELFVANNCLIRNFTPGILYTNPSKSSIICKGWTMQVETILGIDNERTYWS